MGRRDKGYGSSKSRIERLGGGKGRRSRGGRGEGRSVMVDDDVEDFSAHEYTDTAEQELLSLRQMLASEANVDAHNEVQRREGDVFRHDISSLKTWK